MKKGIFKAKWFIPVLVVLAAILIATGAMAASNWTPKTIAGSGVITISDSYTYSLSGIPIAWTSTNYIPNSSVNLTANMTISNTGSVAINSIAITPSPALPSWLSVSTNLTYPIVAGASYVPFKIALTGTAPANATSVDLSQYTFTFQPN